MTLEDWRPFPQHCKINKDDMIKMLKDTPNYKRRAHNERCL